MLWYEHSEPYGKTMTRVSQTGQDILNDRVGTRKGYTGHLNDTAADLVYMKARYYDPQIGRFYSNDPVGFSVGNPMMFNRYGYANNNPYRYIDPDGRVIGDPNAPDDDFPSDINWNTTDYDWSGYKGDLNWESERYKPNEYQNDLAETGQRFSYWVARAAVGDPFASAGLDVTMNQGLGRIANILAATAGEKELGVMGVDIMRAHHRAVIADAENTLGNDAPGKLTKEAIDSYHMDVFSKRDLLGLPLGGLNYGGNLPSGLYYCADCKYYSPIDNFISPAW